MTTIQQGTLLEVLKKKMRSMKEELEVAKEAAEEAQARLQEEVRRREEVRNLTSVYMCQIFWALNSLFTFLKLARYREKLLRHYLRLLDLGSICKQFIVI